MKNLIIEVKKKIINNRSEEKDNKIEGIITYGDLMSLIDELDLGLLKIEMLSNYLKIRLDEKLSKPDSDYLANEARKVLQKNHPNYKIISYVENWYPKQTQIKLIFMEV